MSDKESVDRAPVLAAVPPTDGDRAWRYRKAWLSARARVKAANAAKDEWRHLTRHWGQQATKAQGALAEAEAAIARVRALEAKWAEQIRRGHEENPDGHGALTTHEADLDELRSALDGDQGGGLLDEDGGA